MSTFDPSTDYEIRHAQIVAWTEAKPVGTHIGVRRSRGYCPIAEAARTTLTERGNKPSEMVIGPLDAWAHFNGVSRFLSFDFSLEGVVEDVDGSVLADRSQAVTREEFLEILLRHAPQR